MKRFFIILLWMPLASFAQIRMDANGNKLNGSIKKIVEYEYSLFADSNKNRVPDLTGIYTYNEKSFQVTAYYYSGNDSSNCRYKDVFSYSNDGNLTSKEHYTNNMLYSKIIYLYDSNGRLVQSQQTVTFKNSIQYKYDSVGNKIQENNCGFLPGCEKIIYRYDINNYVIEKDSYHYDTLFLKTSFIYDSAYHYSVMLSKRIGCENEWKTIRRYDDRMNLIEEVSYFKSNDTKGKFQKNGPNINNYYKYDQNGNWIERTYFLYGKIDSYIQRVIT